MHCNSTCSLGKMLSMLAAFLLCCVGCAGPAYTVYDSDFSGGPFPGVSVQMRGFPIDRIGVCGPFSAKMADTFAYAGYPASDLGDDAALCPDKAEAHKLRYVAVCELARDDTPGIGMNYSMFVIDMHSGEPIWREEGEEVPSGRRIRRSQDVELVLHDVVKAFSRMYPPAARRQ